MCALGGDYQLKMLLKMRIDSFGWSDDLKNHQTDLFSSYGVKLCLEVSILLKVCKRKLNIFTCNSQRIMSIKLCQYVLENM